MEETCDEETALQIEGNAITIHRASVASSGSIEKAEPQRKRVEETGAKKEGKFELSSIDFGELKKKGSFFTMAIDKMIFSIQKRRDKKHK